MSAMLSRALRGTALLLAGSLSSAALAEPARLTVEGTVRLGYDLNPFLSAGTDLASPYVEASIEPRLTKRTEKGELSVSGYFDRTEYLQNYGNSNEYGAEFSAKQRLNAKLTVFAGLKYDSEVIGQADDLVTGVPIDDTDINLIGQRRRADTYRASGGFQYQAGPKDIITADSGYTATRYGTAGGADSNNYGGRIGWKHSISERSKIGVSTSVYKIEYDTPGMSTMIIQPNVTFTSKLSPTWTLDASLGVSFSDLSRPGILPDSKSKGLSGSLELCHAGTRDYFCLYANRSVSASGAGGTQERTQVGVNYNRKLTDKIGFTWNGSYARSQSQVGTLGTRQYVSGRAGLDWKMARNIKLGAAGRYRDVFGGPSVKADLGGELYATVELPSR